jgi:hypothetical protein
VKEYVNGEESSDLLSGWSIAFGIKDRLVIGFAPSDNDSTAIFSFHCSDDGAFRCPLPLKPMVCPSDFGRNVYQYGTRPFELVPPFAVGQFIPLALYGSYWYDAEMEGTRFCGDNFIKPDLSSDILKFIPHFYIVGFKIQ